MKCTIIYGVDCNLRYRKEMEVAEAFKYMKNSSWMYYDIYFDDRLVFTTQGAAGSWYICDDCPYYELDSDGTLVKRRV